MHEGFSSSSSSPNECRHPLLLATEWTVGTLQTGKEAAPIEEQVVDIFSMAERMAEEAAAAQEARKNPTAAAEKVSRTAVHFRRATFLRHVVDPGAKKAV
jgi:hypothetical protein